MTFEQIYTLQDAIDEAIAKTNTGTTHEVILWLQKHRRQLLDENQNIIEPEGLGNLIRACRKRPTPETKEETRNLCFDFGLPDLELNTEISIPRDMENVLYCACDWKELDDATIADLDKHIVLLEAQAAANLEQAANLRKLRQAAAKRAKGRTDIPLRDLRGKGRK